MNELRIVGVRSSDIDLKTSQKTEMNQATDTFSAAMDSSAETFLARLAERGVKYVFANAGTDFAPIIEAVARSGGGGRFPRFVTCPHENLAMGMANGYYRIAGIPAAVMVHVTVGTANTICALMNMARDNVPVVLCAGRSPATEYGHIASRNGAIHWGQESFDQGGMLREYVKWDYELRAGQPIGALVDRALDIAMSEPRGPVYLCLPREALADETIPMRRPNIRPLGATPAEPPQKEIDKIAQIVGKAEYPLIVTSGLGRTAEAFEALSSLCNEHAIPVVQVTASDLNLPTDHPMHLGFGADPNPHMQQADVLVVVNSGVPWMPRTAKPKPSTKVIHIGIDPLVSRHPFREFEADMLVAGEPVAAIRMLHEALGRGTMMPHHARRGAISAARDESRKSREALIEQVKDQSPIHPAWFAHCINEAKSEDAIIVNELGTSPARLTLTKPLSYMGTSLAGGLGVALGSGLGAKLAAPDRDVVVVVGDGSYMFGNPTPYHFVQRSENLPTLTIIANNHSWLAVKMSALDVYPSGAASKANSMPIQDLNPSPAFEKVAEASGGYGESVTRSDELPSAMRRAFDKIRSGTPALLNVHTQARR